MRAKLLLLFLLFEDANYLNDPACWRRFLFAAMYGHMGTLATDKPTPTKARKPITKVTVSTEAPCADLEVILARWREDIERSKAATRVGQEPDATA
jgi:hypothetical protein